MLELSNINVSFGQKTILATISLAIKPGERIALLGSSGSGKTTLLRVMVGILRPSGGSVTCGGVRREFDIDTDWNGWVWPQVTLVFQDMRLFPNLTGLRNCMVGARDLAPESVYELADQLGVQHCLDRRPHQMSHGEQQRVAIIRSLLRRPEYLLMDEPTSALDASHQERLADVIHGLPDTVSVLVATHDLGFAASIANRYLAIKDQRVFGAGNLHEAVDLVAGSKRPI